MGKEVALGEKGGVRTLGDSHVERCHDWRQSHRAFEKD